MACRLDGARGRRQAIIRSNSDILPITPQGTYFNEILFEIQIFSFKKMRLKMSSAKWRLFCPGRDELRMGLPAGTFISGQRGMACIASDASSNELGVRTMCLDVICFVLYFVRTE